MFRMDVANADWDVAYVAMVVQYVANVCSQCFICFSNVCCKCVYLDVAYVSHIASVYLDVEYVL